jgi:hypothetical protein
MEKVILRISSEQALHSPWLMVDPTMHHILHQHTHNELPHSSCSQVFTKELDEESFKGTVKDLAARHAAALGKSGEAAILPQELLDGGASWAKQATGALSIRAASMYVARCAANTRSE